MNDERIEELARWARGLEESDAAELRAAGRAIRVLCEENRALARRLAELEDAPVAHDATAEPLDLPRVSERRRPRRRGVRLPWRLVLLALGAVLALFGAVALGARAAAPDVAAKGPEAGAVLGRAALARLAISAPAAEGQTWLLDGEPVRPSRAGGRAILRPGRLADGRHTVVVRRDGPLFTSGERRFTFTVDTRAPVLRLERPAIVAAGKPLRARGTLEAGARLEVSGKSVAVDGDGRFVLTAAQATRSLLAVASDRAGNRSRWRIPVTVVPRRPKEPIRSVHVTAYGWADRTLRAGIMQLVRERRINAVELDLKDESGEIGWDAPVPLARRIGANLRVFDLRKAVEQLHALGVRVIGRLVAFRDPIHARAAWRAGRRAEVVQTPGGGPYAGYGGFTNFAHPAVRKYNIDIAVAAAGLGVDEILYDYVRRPDGPTASMRFPGLEGTPEAAIVRFLAESRAALRKTDAVVGASVFGVAATRPREVAQDIRAMAREVDYVAPMVYPSHWGPGEYDVADPNGSPYEIVRRSLADFQKQVRGTGARVVPWLQDFSLGVTYGPAEVAAQIRAARAAGADEFILWDPAVTYTADALAPTAKVPALGFSTAPPVDARGPVRLPDPKPAAPRSATTAPASAKSSGARPLSGLPPNELGVVPVVMHHQIRPDRVGEYDQTPQEFRAELERLWKAGYVPVTVSDLLDRKLDLPKGTSPVVMTFDDSTREQLALRADGSVEPGTAVGIMLDFARTHPGFEPAGTFFPNREPFGVSNGDRLLRWLVEHGFELGNHTHDHIPLRALADGEIQRQIVLGQRLVHRAVPRHRVRSLALPLGSMPRNARLAVRGSWDGERYGPYAVLLVGANPAPSPFAAAFDPAAIPRIRSSHAGWDGEADFGFAYWMRELGRNPATRYVSDGEPDRIAVPAGRLGDVAPRFRARAAVVG